MRIKVNSCLKMLEMTIVLKIEFELRKAKMVQNIRYYGYDIF